MFYCNIYLLITFFFISILQPTSADGNSFPLSADDQTTIQNDINFLTNGVTALKLPNTPANINVFDKFAYILASTNSVNIWAAGRLGSGKVCAFTGNRFCKMDSSTQPLDNGKAMQNCINWVSNNVAGSLPASSIVGIVTPEMSYSQGFTKSPKTTFQTAQDLNGIQFVVVHEDSLWSLSQSQLDVLASYVKGGGGLIACNAPWDKSTSSMPTNPGNTLLLEAGIRWATDMDSMDASVTINKVPLSDWWKTNPWYIANALAQGVSTPSTIADETTIQGDINFLTNGITGIQLESTPANLIAFGKYSYILASATKTLSVGTTLGTAGVNVWGAGRLGSGKVCAFSANMFCKMGSSPPSDNGKLMQNCVNWVSNNVAGSLPKLNLRYRKRKKAPKYSPEQLEKIPKQCRKLRRLMTDPETLAIDDDEKYFTLAGDNMPGNAGFYTDNEKETPENVKYKATLKFPKKVLVWLALSCKGISQPFIGKSGGPAISKEVYITKCLSKLILFIEKYLGAFLRFRYRKFNFIKFSWMHVLETENFLANFRWLVPTRFFADFFNLANFFLVIFGGRPFLGISSTGRPSSLRLIMR